MGKKILIVMVIIAAIGLMTALLLSYARFAHVDLPCDITSGGCATVAASPYAVMFGVPLAYLGVLYYVAVLIFLVALLRGFRHTYASHALVGITAFGAIDSVYFLYLQGFVINAFCVYCIISAIATFMLAGLGVWYYFSVRIDNSRNEIHALQ